MRSMKCLLLQFVVIGIALILSGCGTMFWGTRQKVDIIAEPEGTKYTLCDFSDSVIKQGITPDKIKLSRKGAYIVNFEAPGYENKKMYITSSVSQGLGMASVFLNLINLSTGVLVDMGTGALNKLTPKAVNCKLQKKK